MQAQPPDELEVVSQSRWYVLAETEDGYGIWRAGQPRTEPPLATYGEDADGFTDADREFRRLNHWIRVNRQLIPTLVWIVFIGAVIWILASAVNALWSFTGMRTPEFRPFGRDILAWGFLLEAVSRVLWQGALAVLLSLWFLRRAGEARRG